VLLEKHTPAKSIISQNWRRIFTSIKSNLCVDIKVLQIRQTGHCRHETLL